MTQFMYIAIDLVVVAVLTFGLYFPRHRRKDMVVAYLVANIGVAVAAVALSSSSFGAGLGLGLFGILSIIRLRSDVLDQPEVAYYFASLALGLLAGIAISPLWLSVALMLTILGALYVGDHPRLFARQRVQIVNLDRAFTDEAALSAYLEELLSARVDRVTVRKVDLVNDTTSVEVRYHVGDARHASIHETAVVQAIGGRS